MSASQNLEFLSKMNKDGDFAISKLVIFWYAVMAKSLFLLVGSMTSSVNGNDLLKLFYPDSTSIIISSVYAVVCLVFLQVYVFASSMTSPWQKALLKSFKKVSLVFILLDVVFATIYYPTSLGFVPTFLMLGVNVLMFLSFFQNDYLDFYISYYANKSPDEDEKEDE